MLCLGHHNYCFVQYKKCIYEQLRLKKKKKLRALQSFSRCEALNHGSRVFAKHNFVICTSILSITAFILVLYSFTNREASDTGGSASGCTDSIMDIYIKRSVCAKRSNDSIKVRT